MNTKKLAYALLASLALMALPFPSIASDIVASIGRLDNNCARTHSNCRLFDVSVRKSDVIGDLELQVSYTQVQQSDFGNHNGHSEETWKLGLIKPWEFGDDFAIRAGGGALAAVHYPWGPHYDPPMTKVSYKAECIMCGYFVQLSLDWKFLEFTVRYDDTGSNFWPSHKGLEYMLGYRYVFDYD